MNKERENNLDKADRRNFLRLKYHSPLMYKVCKKQTFSKLMQGYTHDVSSAGLMCSLESKVPVDSIVWFQLDIGALSLCTEIEKRCAVVQRGILGKVVWADRQEDKNYDVGVCFVTREEKQAEDFLIRNRLV